MTVMPQLNDRDPGASSRASLVLRCPRCATTLGLISEGSPLFETGVPCLNCSFVLEHDRGIWLALPPERLRHFNRFLTEYQIVRATEGRGSTDASFYLSLPYRDTTGRNEAQWEVRAKTYRYIESKILSIINPLRQRLDILDLGAGNGWLSYRLASLGHRPVAVDLLVNNTDGLGAASHYLQKLRALFPRFQAELSHLPFENSQFDCAIFNASFHYSENYAETLAETLRCLRPGGTVIIADTPWYANDESGRQMLRERRINFQQQYGFPSDGIGSLEYLTDQRLHDLESLFGIRWQVFRPNYGLRWALRPVIAKINGRREPSSFRVYVAKVETS